MSVAAVAKVTVTSLDKKSGKPDGRCRLFPAAFVMCRRGDREPLLLCLKRVLGVTPGGNGFRMFPAAFSVDAVA